MEVCNDTDGEHSNNANSDYSEQVTILKGKPE